MPIYLKYYFLLLN